jgi:phosphoglycerate kinase
VAGLLMDKEIEMLSSVLKKPDHPLVFIIGGAKISTKIKVIKNLIKQVDSMLLGGALVNNILKASGKEVGKSKIEEKMMEEAKKLIPFLKNEGSENNLYMPKDYIVAKEASNEAKPRISKPDDIKKDEMILDIGPETIEFYKDIISKAKMVIWNGPMGMFEITKFASGSYETAKAVAASKAKSIIGGGETLDLVKSLGLEGDVFFVSTGGGAMLKFLEGEELPGIKALLDK